MIDAVADRLPGLLAHELRNPLASAMTGAMLARDMVDEGDPRATVLDGVLRDLDRVEIYRELTVDPKEARRLRYKGARAKRRAG